MKPGKGWRSAFTQTQEYHMNTAQEHVSIYRSEQQVKWLIKKKLSHFKMRNKSSEAIDLLVFPKHWKLRLNQRKQQRLLSSSCRQSRRPFREMYVKNSKPIACEPWKHKKSGTAGKIPALLTGKDRGEEDVVRKRNESALPERIENAVLIGKLLPLLGQLLFKHPSHTPKRGEKATG